MSDIELLREYARCQSESAFATLVSRHVDLVYSAAMRHVGNHHHAEEITQAVFLILARKARTLGHGTILPGWLFQTTRLTAANYLRTEIRRVRREQEAFMPSNPDDNTADPWQQLAPLLNDAIASLGEKDRDAIVLRFLKGKDFKEVGAALGGTEEAAQMRVGRALEKLRKLFAKRGVVLSTGALGAVLVTNATQAAPAGFAAAVAASAIHGATLAASTATLAKGTLDIMAWTKTQFAVGAGVLILLAYQQHENSTQAQQLASAREALRHTGETLTAQQSRIAELDQETGAIIEIEHSQEAELRALRARRTTTVRADGSNSGAGVPTTLLSATLHDPETREIFYQDLINENRARFRLFAQEANLSPDEVEKFIRSCADGTLRTLDAVAAFTEGKLSAEAVVAVQDEALRDATNQVRLRFGEASVAPFEADVQSRPARVLIEEFKKLGVFPITDSEREALFNILQSEPFEVTSGLAGDVPVQAVVFPEEMNRWFEAQAKVNQSIRQRAGEFLAPEQVETMALIQTRDQSALKSKILRMLRKP